MKMGQRIPATGRHSHMAEIHDHASDPFMADAQRRTISSGNSQDYIHSIERSKQQNQALSELTFSSFPSNYVEKDIEELDQDSEHETVEELTSMQKLEIEDNYSERKTPGEEGSLVSAEVKKMVALTSISSSKALTRARVPIVKLMDPVTGLSCDICVNNLLAVVNTKLLKDYAQIDERLRQLAFIVKHWATSRRVNETYQGTLSSYASNLKFSLSTASSFLDSPFSSIVVFVRIRGSRSFSFILLASFKLIHFVLTSRKQEKDWTRRIGNDRYLICIEDPFNISHDLGRVVDKYSIKILREEFERAADIMQYEQPCFSAQLPEAKQRINKPFLQTYHGCQAEPK
ncbi:hypothetical protein ZIOFF_056659 [Zingiber officinale]|uniref:Poly(A) RNA polymerase mitochondrial-like central palm domain-containing protein n=1 Tax=Zingiber officinale TaxID=94328 RepID=A0A8J5FIB4_ZINOF|nr:hypothetical protein ZIOFF_056659 [Zingiber officinale]